MSGTVASEKAAADVTAALAAPAQLASDAVADATPAHWEREVQPTNPDGTDTAFDAAHFDRAVCQGPMPQDSCAAA